MKQLLRLILKQNGPFSFPCSEPLIYNFCAISLALYSSFNSAFLLVCLSFATGLQADNVSPMDRPIKTFVHAATLDTSCFRTQSQNTKNGPTSPSVNVAIWLVIIPITLKEAIWRFYYLLTALQTASNMYAQVARAQSCANQVQHIERLSCATCRVALGTKGQLSF